MFFSKLCGIVYIIILSATFIFSSTTQPIRKYKASETFDKQLNYAEQKLISHDAKTTNYLPFNEESEYSIKGFILKLFVSLVLIFLLFIIIRKLLKRSQIFSPNLGDTIKLLYRLPIAAKKYLCLVSVVDAIYIIGISENNISLISKINSKETVDAIKLELSKTKNIKTGFSNLFSQMTDNNSKNTVEKEDFFKEVILDNQIERIKSL